MANPVVQALAVSGGWVKVADNVTTVAVTPLTRPRVYSWTYRDHGDPAPADDSESLSIPATGLSLQAAAAIDLYCKVKDHDGSLRVDVDLALAYVIDG